MDEKKKAIGIAAYESQQLVARLKKAVDANSYEIIPYSELSKLIGFDVQRDGRGYLNTARKRIEQDTGRLFGIVATEGVKMLTVEEQLAVGPAAIERTKRHTKRTLNRVVLVETAKLTPDQLKSHNVTASVLGAVHLFTQPKSVAKIEAAVSTSTEKLAIGDTLKLFEK